MLLKTIDKQKMHKFCIYYWKIHFFEKCIFLEKLIFLLLNFLFSILDVNTYRDVFEIQAICAGIAITNETTQKQIFHA